MKLTAKELKQILRDFPYRFSITHGKNFMKFRAIKVAGSTV